MAERERRPENLLEFLFGELARGFQDVRSKLVDEGWFGRRGPSTSPDLGRQWTEGTSGSSDAKLNSFDREWAVRPPAEPTSDHNKGHEIDR